MNALSTAEQKLDRALMLVNAFGYNRSPPEQDSLGEEEQPFHQRLIGNIVPFLMFFVKLFTALIGLVLLSVITYWFVYSAVIMRGLEVQSHPIFFDYSDGGPFARVDLRSTSVSPWIYSCENCHVHEHKSAIGHQFCTQEADIQRVCNNGSPESADSLDQTKQSNKELELPNSNPILKAGQSYFMDVVLTLPESEVNKKLGMFMLTVDLRFDDGSLLARSKQSSLFPYESGLVSLTRKFITLLPLLSGIIEETKTLSLLCFDNYMDSERTLSYAEVKLEVPHLASYPATTQSIQILSAEFHYGKMMSPMQRFFRRWYYFCAFVGVFVLFMCYTVLALHLASRKGWLLNRRAYYSAFEIFGSDTDSSYHFEAHSQQNSWAGSNIEILDEDDDEWEPLDSSSAQNTNKSNIIPDDDSIMADNGNAPHDPEPAATAFPLGPLSQNPNVQNHQTMFSSREASQINTLNETQAEISNGMNAQEEEKCLADMVMKGLSKFEVFTDQDDPDIQEILPSIQETSD